MSDTEATDLRTELGREREGLRQRLASLTKEGAGALDFDENFADSGQVAAEQGENLALAASLQDQLDDVEAALGRLDDGTYGRCETCGEPIPAARLEAMPAARTCINHVS
ncbi:MAG: TraR/DksA C4-type zinc finger protein [Actinomycetota bacterium]|nr:TraR/DksA C4-type zinc finger protein [Actinomycetota bacterium]